jgi:hypothetical protein
MELHPEELGLLFQQGEGGKRTFESAIVNFGKKGFQAIIEVFSNHNLYPFMVAVENDVSEDITNNGELTYRDALLKKQ